MKKTEPEYYPPVENLLDLIYEHYTENNPVEKNTVAGKAAKANLKVVNHRLEMEVRKGDIVQAGVMISNSEVGLGAVSIQPLVYRLVCTNGMVVNDMGERRHHVGRQARSGYFCHRM